MVLPYMVTWIPSIYPMFVSIYTSTMDPMGYELTCLMGNSLQIMTIGGVPPGVPPVFLVRPWF